VASSAMGVGRFAAIPLLAWIRRSRSKTLPRLVATGLASFSKEVEVIMEFRYMNRLV